MPTKIDRLFSNETFETKRMIDGRNLSCKKLCARNSSLQNHCVIYKCK